MEVQVVLQAVFVMMTTLDCDMCWSGDNAAIAGVLPAGTKAVVGTLGFIEVLLFTTLSAIKEVGMRLADSKELIRVEESEQLVSVTVVLSVTVTADTSKGFSRMEVEVLEKEVLRMMPETVEMGKIDMDPPGTGVVMTLMSRVELKRPAITLLQRRGRSAFWAGW
jgi:hypothetical protein